MNQQQWGQKKGLEDLTGRLITTSKPPTLSPKSGEAANGSPKTVAATVADNGIWETYMICKEVRELITLIAELEAIINEKPLADIEEIGLKLRLEDFLNPGSTRGGQLTEKKYMTTCKRLDHLWKYGRIPRRPKKNEFIVHLVFKSIEEQNTTSALERYYYYESIDECLPFSYGSCIENGNGFDSMNDASVIVLCIQIFSQENDDNDEENSIMIDNIRRFEPLFSLPELCLLPEDAGPCFGEILRWRYNSETNHCETFIYTGCNHNANYFTSEEACLRACEEYRNSGN
ncbi:Papilin [Dirofilaria immitis]